MKGIIYKWTCNRSGKSYIGQTINEKRREKEFLTDKEPYTNSGSKIDNARKKYGLSEGVWKKEVLKRLWCKEGKENGLIERLNFWEKYYIKKYDTFLNGYNSTDGGSNCFLMSEGVKKKCKYWLGKNHDHKTNETIRKKLLGRHISANIKKKIKNSILKSESFKSQCKAVKQYDLNGTFIKEYTSIGEACLNTGVKHKSIVKCAKGLQKSSKGFVWKFSNDADLNTPQKPIKGYYFNKHKNKYKAKIRKGGKEYALGYFWNEKSAAEMYKYACNNSDNLEQWFKDIEKHKKEIMEKYGA